jgi:hypothetical protein
MAFRGRLFLAYAPRVTAPFPWTSLPKADRRTSRLVALLPPRAPVVAAAVRPLAERLTDPTAGVVRLRLAGTKGYVVVGGTEARALAQRVLGGPDELPAPRSLTPAERAVLAVAVAQLVDELDLSVEVEPTELGAAQVAAELGDGAVVELDTPHGPAALVLPVSMLLAPPRAPLADLPLDRLDGLDLPATLVLAATRLDRTALAGLRPRDVVVADRLGPRNSCEIRVARGAFRGLVTTGGRVTVQASYARAPMDETLGDDATVEIAVAVGDVRMSVRSLLELKAGQVVELGRPLGSAVELRVGSKVIARGELVDVDGDIGVRVTQLETRK